MFYEMLDPLLDPSKIPATIYTVRIFKVESRSLDEAIGRLEETAVNHSADRFTDACE